MHATCIYLRPVPTVSTYIRQRRSYEKGIIGFNLPPSPGSRKAKPLACAAHGGRLSHYKTVYVRTYERV